MDKEITVIGFRVYNTHSVDKGVSLADVEEQGKTLALRGSRRSCWMAIPINCDVTQHSGMIWSREEFCGLDIKMYISQQK